MQNALLAKCRKNFIVHPRLSYQNLPATDPEHLAAVVFPDLQPFPGKEYHQLIVVIDWDHKLPSRKMFGRVFAYYTAEAFALAWRESQIRRREIAARNDYPEFDVHDFEDIPADESYQLHLNLEGECRKVEFLSSWKHQIQEIDRERVLAVLDGNPAYQEALASRRQSCGPAKPVMWVPPCVSRLPVWTVDTRLLVYCEGPAMWGRFFLVDIAGERVLHSGNFHMRG